MSMLVIVLGLLHLSLFQILYVLVWLWHSGLLKGEFSLPAGVFLSSCSSSIVQSLIPCLVMVFQLSRITMYWCVLASRAFQIRSFAVFTADSTFLFASNVIPWAVSTVFKVPFRVSELDEL